MMVDMGQADRTLRMRPNHPHHNVCWTVAVHRAALSMGFKHHMDVPNERNDELKTLARSIQQEAES